MEALQNMGLPSQVLKQMPTKVVKQLAAAASAAASGGGANSVHHINSHKAVNLATEEDLLGYVKRQWRPELSFLNYFLVDAPPRQPFTRELTHSPPRSRYYETFICTWTFAFSILLIYCVEYAVSRQDKLRALYRSPRVTTSLQFLLFVVPFLICVVDFPIANYLLFVLPFNIICLCIYLACLAHRLSGSNESDTASGDESSSQPPVVIVDSISPNSSSSTTNGPPTFNGLLSIYRSIVYISTAVCIFARDQPCWNNKFSKTYSFGTGLMDVGIGCFTVCIGSLGPTALRRAESVNRSQTLRKAAVQAAILTACGLVKVISRAIISAFGGSGGGDDWREYGMHWNAFFSLAVARGLGTALELLVLPRRMPPLLAAVIVAVGQEAALAGGIAQLVLAPGLPDQHQGSNIIGQNREGVSSIPGLIVLYFAGLQLGRWTQATAAASDSYDSPEQRRGRLATLAKILSLLAASLMVRPLAMWRRGAVLMPESRRLMNPAYSAWVLAFSCFCLTWICALFEARRWLPPLAESGGVGGGVEVGDVGDRGSAWQRWLTPLHLRQVDSLGLLYFIVSNLLTGLFNFLISMAVGNRESIDGAPCFLVILVYTVSAFALTRLAARWLSFRVLQVKLMRLFCPAG